MYRESIPVLFDFTSGVGVAQWGLLVSAVVPFVTTGGMISAGTSVMEKMSREAKEERRRERMEAKERSDRLEAIRLSERREDMEERRRERREDRLIIICGATFLTILVYFLNKN